LKFLIDERVHSSEINGKLSAGTNVCIIVTSLSRVFESFTHFWESQKSIPDDAGIGAMHIAVTDAHVCYFETVSCTRTLEERSWEV
jgi:hypothetical protein